MIYIIQNVRAVCPDCNKPVKLLCEKDITMTSPMFYICWNCDKVYQTGVGEVKHVE